MPVILALGLASSACTSAVAAQPPAPPAIRPTLVAVPIATADNTWAAANGVTQVDQQGMVVVELAPLNLGDEAGTLDFDVAMNTHSVDLGMDLAQLATLSADTGVTVQAGAWVALGGGHHVKGTLRFPADVNGTPVLEGATKITVTIVNVDSPARVFTWQVP